MAMFDPRSDLNPIEMLWQTHRDTESQSMEAAVPFDECSHSTGNM